jgi:hypothetical protein
MSESSTAATQQIQIGVLKRTMLNHAIVIMVAHVISMVFRLMVFAGP